ncbi:MAG: hypothetical protein AB7O97_03815 [Planctomycetota bacterium]
MTRPPVSSRWRALAALALLVPIAVSAGCRRRGPAGPVGPAGPFDATALPAPTDLRLRAHPGGPPRYVLRWNLDQPDTAIGAFAIYASTQPMPFADPQALVAAVDGALRSAEIELAADTGLRHLRVAGISEAGVTGALSAELVVDTIGRIVFEAATTQDIGDLYAVHPATGAPAIRVSEGTLPSLSRPHRLSPDGRRAAFLGVVAGDPQLVSGPLDGSDAPATLSPGLGVFSRFVPAFEWSPDGRRVAFVTGDDLPDLLEVYVATPGSGAPPTKVSGTMVPGGTVWLASTVRGGASAAQGVLSWSPDNRRVAYLATQRDESIPEVMVAAADGIGEPVPANGAATASGAMAFAWSPDGARLAVLDRGAGTNQLFVTTATPGAAPVPLPDRADGSGAPSPGFAWSPDGSRLLYAGAARAPGFAELFVADPTGATAPVTLLPEPVAATTFSGTWSPDGTQVAFLAQLDETVELFVSPATGGAAPAAVSGSSRPGVGVQGFAWSPDGAQLAFLAATAQQTTALFVANPGVAAEPLQVSPAFDQVREFAWSTSGDRLAWIHDDGDTTPALRSVSRLGGAATTLLSQDGLGALSWSRLGAR